MSSENERLYTHTYMYILEQYFLIFRCGMYTSGFQSAFHNNPVIFQFKKLYTHSTRRYTLPLELS